jgi:signal transduction histidine kinase
MGSMRRFIFISIILLQIISLRAQTASQDSISKLLKAGKEDTTQVMLISELSRSMQWSNPDSAYTLALEGIKLARKIDYYKGEMYCKVSAAACSWSLGNYALSIELLLPIIPEAEKTKDIKLLATIYGNIHNAYRDQGDYNEALKYGSMVDRFSAFVDSGRYRKVGKAALAFLYLHMGKKDSMGYYIQRALEYPPSPGLDGWIFSVAGSIYTDQKKYDSAFLYYRLSIPTLIKENNQKDLAWTYNNISSLFKLTGQPDSALLYVNKSITLSKGGKFAKEAMESNLLLAELYESEKSDSALYYFKKAIASRDSLYNQEKQKQILGYKFKEELYRQEAEAEKKQKESKVKQYFLAGLGLFFLAVAFLLFRNNKQKQKAKEKVEEAYTELKTTQAQLIQSEKMASLGELTAGIAHEIQNPLNFVNNFSEVNEELLKELKAEAEKGNLDEVKAIAKDIGFNSEKINHHGKRADAIVKGMLQHSRTSSGQREPTDINALADEYLRLAYHGLRAKDKSFNATMKTEFDVNIGKINVVPQEIGRVILNLINNAFYAVDEKKKHASTGSALNGYEPIVFVSTKKLNGKIEIKVKDNGNGIPQKVLDKIFQPFFTTKPTGQGTGLGLSLSYDIVKAHGGELEVESKEREGSEFIILLPIN